MSDLRLYVRDKDGRETSYVIHYATGCRLVSAINEETDNFNPLLKSTYEFNRGIHNIIECEDNEKELQERARFRSETRI